MSVPVRSCDNDALTATCKNVTKIRAEGWLVFYRQVIPVVRVIQNTRINSVFRIVRFISIVIKAIKTVNFDSYRPTVEYHMH